MMKVVNVRRLGSDGEVGGAGGGGMRYSSMNQLKAENESYLKIQQQDDRLTVKLCHRVIG